MLAPVYKWNNTWNGATGFCKFPETSTSWVGSNSQYVLQLYISSCCVISRFCQTKTLWLASRLMAPVGVAMATTDKPDWSHLAVISDVVQSKETFTPSCLWVFFFYLPLQALPVVLLSSLSLWRIPVGLKFLRCIFNVLSLPLSQHCLFFLSPPANDPYHLAIYHCVHHQSFPSSSSISFPLSLSPSVTDLLSLRVWKHIYSKKETCTVRARGAECAITRPDISWTHLYTNAYGGSVEKWDSDGARN